jgi:hypothetical protein
MISTTTPTRMQRLCLLCGTAALTLALATLAACNDAQPRGSSAASTIGVELTGYNHTDKTIGAFYVNGQWGSNITPGSGGGSFVCCADLPIPWRPDLEVTVKWEDHDGVMHERKVPVPRYEPKQLGGLNVHFLRNGDIKVFANMLSLWHPDYPLKGEEAELKPGHPIVPLPRQ